MTTNTSAVQSAINALLDTLSPDDALSAIGDYLHDRSVPYVIWHIEDFEAQVREDWGNAIPEGAHKLIARTAYEQATDTLSDTRNVEVMNQFIDGAWGDYLNTENQPTGYKLRLRNPDNRSEVQSFIYPGIDGGAAHQKFQQAHPDMAHWGIVSISETD